MTMTDNTAALPKQDLTYEDVARAFAHAKFARHPANYKLRQALSDLANEMTGDQPVSIAGWLEAVRDFAATLPYGDMCPQCARDEGRHVLGWPYSTTVHDGFLRGTYSCDRGHQWSCSYIVNLPRLFG